MLKNFLSAITPDIRDFEEPNEKTEALEARAEKREHEVILGADGKPVLEDGEPRVLRPRNRRRGHNVLQEAVLDENIAHSSQVHEEEEKKTKKKKRPNATLPPEFDLFVDTEDLFTYSSLTKGMEARTVRMEDWKCLHFSELLSDVVVDFWLQNIFMEKLTEAQRDRTYIFPASFYTWYSPAPTFNGWNQGENKDMRAAERRFNRIKEMLPQIDLMQKDFIIWPCLDHEHWFLVILCYPRLKGVVSFEDENSILPKEFGERDPAHPTEGEAVKQSCILIFDSVKDKSGRRRKAFEHVKTLMESISDEFDRTAVITASVKVSDSILILSTFL